MAFFVLYFSLDAGFLLVTLQSEIRNINWRHFKASHKSFLNFPLKTLTNYVLTRILTHFQNNSNSNSQPENYCAIKPIWANKLTFINPLVPTAPLVARLALWTTIARVVYEIEINGQSSKVGARILHNLLSIQHFQFWTIVHNKQKSEVDLFNFSCFSLLPLFCL